MFENSNTAQTPKLQPARAVLAQSKRVSSGSLAPASTHDTTAGGLKSGSGHQHLKNALNLGKAMGAKVNDLLRRKEQSSLGDIGVTEVNKNVGAVLTGASKELGNGGVKLQDTFPRLEPPPPIVKKRMARSLKTTQDMMISSQPVVNSPEASDVSFNESPDKTPLVQNGKAARDEEEQSSPAMSPYHEQGGNEAETSEALRPELDAQREKDDDDDILEDTNQQLLSVPDLIHKETLDLKQRSAGQEGRMTSTPQCGKMGLHISISEDDLLENGSEDSGVPRQRSSSVDEEEHHPDLLSFE
ncbi:uncharacterized protein C1orf226 [Erpetoichthys calabaricus]|uniref:Carboxyl-terminal PDZ ligand of neuronal nitric oxide synthase protein-like n=1 Tax=Erpetoichthys calabaricus TaxID=27687 RepID=A0A8C4SIF2_ERPCA|nr:uncharacterized protein C1orf226 [Erpetoichthys calabaricus]